MQWLDMSAVSDETKSQSIKVSNNLEEYSRVVASLYDFCHEHHIKKETRGNLQLILEESVTNAMKYAYPKGVEGFIEILFKADNKWFSITLIDCGKAFNPLKIDTSLKAESDDEDIIVSREKGGMGIIIIKEYADKVTYTYIDDGNRLEMLVRIT